LRSPEAAGGRGRARRSPRGGALRVAREGTRIALRAAVSQVRREASERSLARLGRRAAGLAHDLGKPLFVAEHTAERMLRRPLDPGLRADLETIRAMAREIHAALHDFVRELRGERLPPAPSPLATVVARALDVTGNAHGRGRVRLRLDREARLVAVPARLVRPLVNLLENALLASPPDLRVELRACVRRDSLRIEVADRGPGLPPGLAARPFALVRPGRPGRTGLGLAASRDLVCDLGGRLELASERQRGTRARIVLPRPPGAGARERRAGTEPGSRVGLRAGGARPPARRAPSG
jgi:signal transduction histidine kinase